MLTSPHGLKHLYDYTSPWLHVCWYIALCCIYVHVLYMVIVINTTHSTRENACMYALGVQRVDAAWASMYLSPFVFQDTCTDSSCYRY